MRSTLNILLVEDELILGDLTREGLTLLGHSVTWVISASAAFDVLRTAHAFDVIVLDLRLGDSRGDTVFEKLQPIRIKYPPVIVLSAEPAHIIQSAARRIGTPLTLSKPASLDQLNAKVCHAVASA